MQRKPRTAHSGILRGVKGHFVDVTCTVGNLKGHVVTATCTVGNLKGHVVTATCTVGNLQWHSVTTLTTHYTMGSLKGPSLNSLNNLDLINHCALSQLHSHLSPDRLR